MSLKPQNFKYIGGTSNRIHTGFVAQEVKEALDTANISTNEFAGYIEDNVVNTELDDNQLWLRYEEFIPLNTHMIQKLYQKISYLEDEIERLKGEK